MAALKSLFWIKSDPESTRIGGILPFRRLQNRLRSANFATTGLFVCVADFDPAAVKAAQAKILAVTPNLAEIGGFARLNNVNNSSTRQY